VQPKGEVQLKDKFSEYYPLNDSQIKHHWQNDVFSFDANVLLNLYRYTPKTRDAFFSLLDKIKDRIWISYQAAHEYQKNRLIVINAQKEAYQEIRDTLEKKKNEIEAKLNGFTKHPYLQASDLKKQIESAFKAISRDLDKLQENHPDYLSQDPIFDRLTALLDKRIGDDFEQPELEKMYAEGKKRYEQKIPPGYMDGGDKKGDGNRSLYGDLIVWKQIIKNAKDTGKSIIFVTDDLKEDWWYKFKGKTISARPELVKEFRDETGQRISIYQADRFLEYANKNLSQNTTQDAIDEVRKVRLADEKEIEVLLANHLRKLLTDVKFSTLSTEHNEKMSKSNFESAFDDYIETNKTGDKK
jgi:hypothetical protein